MNPHKVRAEMTNTELDKKVWKVRKADRFSGIWESPYLILTLLNKAFSFFFIFFYKNAWQAFIVRL